MPSLGRITNPHQFEEREDRGKYPNFYLGIVQAIDDDIEGLNRVSVSIPELDPDARIPGNEDGFDLLVAEQFVCNGREGGSTRFIEPGVQVMVMCRYPGSLDGAIVTWCLPSRVDRPSSELDRRQRKHGMHTTNDTIQCHDDNNGASVDARPNGCCDRVSGEGDRTIQTEGGATSHLSRDGTVQMQNPQGSTSIAPDGTIESRNANQGSMTLNADGTLAMKSIAETSLELAQQGAVLSGPPGTVALLVKKIESLLGPIGEARTLLLQLVDSVAGLKDGRLSRQDFYLEIEPRLKLLKQILATNLDEFKATLDAINNLPENQKIASVMNQARAFTEGGLAEASRAIKDAIANPEIEGSAQLISHLKEILPPQFRDRLGFDLVKILDGLLEQPDIQIQAILEEIAPGQFGGIQNIVGMNLQSSLDIVDRLFNVEPPAWMVDGLLPSDEDIQEWTQHLNQLVGQVLEQIPSEITEFFNHDIVQDLLSGFFGGGSDPIAGIFGKVIQGLTDKLSPKVEEGLQYKEAAIAVADAATALLANPAAEVEFPNFGKVSAEAAGVAFSSLEELTNPTPEQLATQQTPQEDKPLPPEQYLADEIKQLEIDILPILIELAREGNRLINTMDAGEPGGTITATQDMVENRMANSTQTTRTDSIESHLVERQKNQTTRETTVNATHDDVSTTVTRRPLRDRNQPQGSGEQVEEVVTRTAADGITQEVAKIVGTQGGEIAERVVTAIAAGGINQAVIKNIAGQLEETITSMTLDGIENKVRDAILKITEDGIESKVKDAVLKLAGDYIEAQVGTSGLVPKLLVNAGKASLVGIGSEVFAGLGGGAGFSTPWGSFSLGSLGGSLFSQGQLAMLCQQLLSFQVAEDLNAPDFGQTAGLVAAPQYGAALASWSQGQFAADDPAGEAWQTAKVGVSQGRVDLDYQSIYLNGEDVTQKLYEALHPSTTDNSTS